MPSFVCKSPQDLVSSTPLPLPLLPVCLWLSSKFRFSMKEEIKANYESGQKEHLEIEEVGKRVIC